MSDQGKRDLLERLQRRVARAREAFLDAATEWNQTRHRFLTRIGRQPKPNEKDESEPPPK